MKPQVMTARRMLLAALAAGGIHALFPLHGASQVSPAAGESQRTVASSQLPAAYPAAARLAPSVRTVGSEKGQMRYRQIWGIDNLKLQTTASGGLIRFSYRVEDVSRIAGLNDKKNDPYLLIEKTGARLGVQTAERVGQLRQVATPQNGRTYWMIFGNSAHLVRPGDRVDIVIGKFRAYGLFVEAPQAAMASRP